MSPHFCKVGKIKPSLNISIREFENRISNFVEDLSKVDYPKNFSSITI